MRPAALRWLLSWTVGGCASLALVAAEAPSRAAPTRPGSAAQPSTKAPQSSAKPAPTATRPNPSAKPAPQAAKRENISAKEIASQLGLTASVSGSGRKLTLSDRTRRLEMEADSRETRINGVRVFLGDAVRLSEGEFYVSKIDYAACLVPMLRPALIAPLPPAPKVVVLDAGHGGADTGMGNAELGLKEKELTLDVALRLKKLLETRGYRVVLTRKDDRALHELKLKDFEKRIEVANEAGADLFVSIHFNSLFPDRKTGGTEVYTFTRAHQRSDRSWGAGQHDDTEVTPAPVNRFDAASGLLAHAIHRELLGELKTADRGLKTMHSAVLRGLKCPAVLVESVFLSNDHEAKLAATPAYRQRIAEAMVSGIEHYASTIRAVRGKK